MALGKQAKILIDKQIRAVLAELDTRRYPLRDRVMFFALDQSRYARPGLTQLRRFRLSRRHSHTGSSTFLDIRQPFLSGTSRVSLGQSIFKLPKLLRYRALAEISQFSAQGVL
jgi:hypothetical protein